MQWRWAEMIRARVSGSRIMNEGMGLNKEGEKGKDELTQSIESGGVMDRLVQGAAGREWDPGWKRWGKLQVSSQL